MSSPDLQAIRRLLVACVADRPAITAAQLKVSLILASTQSGLTTFDERRFGYKKFSSFLERECLDLITLDYPDGPGDLRITLRTPLPAGSSAQTKGRDEEVRGSGSLIRIRNEVWQAFTNPDPRRKRFFCKRTSAIHHFIEGQSSEIERDVRSNVTHFIEIAPIVSTTQSEWMREFLSRTSLPDNERRTISQIVSQPYSSVVNLMFTRSLGESGRDWREFRVKKVLDVVQKWADSNDVPFERLRSVQSAEKSVAQKAVNDEKSLRDQLSAALEMLSAEDIKTVVLPTAIACVLLRVKMSAE